MDRRRVGLLVGIVLILSGGPAAAAAPAMAPATLTAIDSYVADRMAELHIPGLALTVIVDGTVALERGYGVADGTGRPVAPDTPFVLGSTSKQFTGIAIEQLILAGRLELDAPFARYVPWFGSGSDPHARITIRHLLAHTSGIEGFMGAANRLEDGGPSDTLEANARRLAGEPLRSEPGSNWAYTNSNYDLLGYLIEVVSGQSYAEYMRDHVFEPLGLRDTYTDEATAREHGVAAGYYPWFGLVTVPTPMPYPRSSVPSAFVISSARDLGRLMLAQLGHLPDGSTEVDEAVLAATRDPLTEGDVRYAAGWFVRRLSEVAGPGQDPSDPALPLFYSHPGQATTFRSFVGFAPDLDFGVAVTMNATDALGNAPIRWDDVAEGVVDIALGLEPGVSALSSDILDEQPRLIAALAVLLQLSICVWSLRSRRRLALGVAMAVNLATLYLSLVFVPGRAGEPLIFVLRLFPDLGVMIVVSVAVTVGWLVAEARRLIARRTGPTARSTI